MFTNLLASNIEKEYENIKKNMSIEKVMASQNFFFASSYTKVSSEESIDIEMNKQIAYSKLIQHLETLIDWPLEINSGLRNALWNFHTNMYNFNFKNSQLVDSGKIGDSYFVIVGIPKQELLKNKVSYQKIINNLKKMK